MLDPVDALLRHATGDDIYLRYMDDPEAYRAAQRASASACERLCATLDEAEKKLLDILLDEKATADISEEEAVFTAGLAFGLQLLKLL